MSDVVLGEQLSSEGIVVFEGGVEERSRVAATRGAQTPDLYGSMQGDKCQKVTTVQEGIFGDVTKKRRRYKHRR